MAKKEKKLIIPPDITKIENKAYYEREDIIDVDYDPDACSLEQIAPQAFEQCRNLESVHLPDSITWIGANAFNNCNALMSLNLPLGLKNISPYLLVNCKSLKNVDIPKGVSEIGEGAFSGSGIKSIDIPEGVRWIQRKTFKDCYYLESVTLPPGVKKIDREAFSCCRSLKKINLPEGLQQIEESAFYFCSSLEEIYIPGSVRHVGAEAFMHCSNLKTIIIGEGVHTLPDSVFRDCDSLEKLVLPESTQFIYKYTFHDTGDYFREINLSGYRAIITNGASFYPNATDYIRRAKDIVDYENFSDELARDLKVPLYVDIYGKTRNPIVGEYLVQEGQFAVENALDSGNSACLAALCEFEGLINKENIDEYIQRAIDSKVKESFVILLQHKKNISGFDESNNRFQL